MAEADDQQTEAGSRKTPTDVTVEAVPLSLSLATEDEATLAGARKSPLTLVVDAVALS